MEQFKGTHLIDLHSDRKSGSRILSVGCYICSLRGGFTRTRTQDRSSSGKSTLSRGNNRKSRSAVHGS